MSAPTKDEVRSFDRMVEVIGTCVIVVFAVAVVFAYRLGYADARRADRPLLAPPTKAERAR
jgi:hypothetical protein